MMNLRKLSISNRLTLLFASVSTTVLLSMGVSIGRLVDLHFEELDRELLTGKLELVSSAISEMSTIDDAQDLKKRLDAALVGHHGLVVSVWKSNGVLIYSTEGADFPSDPKTRQLLASAQNKTVMWMSQNGHSYRSMSAIVPHSALLWHSMQISVSTDLSNHQLFMRSFMTALWVIVAAAAFFSGLLGWFVVRRGLSPLREISRDASAITADKLNQRLSSGAFPVELVEVVQTLNEMLARLETSFKRLSDFSSDLAHELRTPVTNLLTQTQVTLAKERSVSEYQSIIASNAEEFERLSRTIGDMLFLAKAENSLLIPHNDTVDLAHEVASLFEFYEALAEDKKLRLICAGSATVKGDALMLRRAIGNLLSNAVRHADVDGYIAISLDDSNKKEAIIKVENSGETIDPEHLPRLFDRFYRADRSRQHFSEGAGLGLAITRSIIAAHGGTVIARSSNSITYFEVRIPL